MGLFPTGLGTRFWLVIGATFLGFLGVGTVLPALAPHVRHDLGGTDQTVGFAIGIFSLVALASRFFSGPLADRRGRKIAFLTGLLSCALAGAVYFLPLGIAGIYLGRMMQGFGEACLYTGAAAWAVEVAGIRRSGQALGYVSSGIWGGISAGPLIGQWLGSFQRAALMQVIAALVAAALLTRVHEEYEPADHPPRRRWVPASLLAPGLTMGFVNVHYPVVAGFLILHLAKHGNSGPPAYSAYAMLILLSRFFLGGLPDRIHPAITFYGGLVAMSVGLMVIAASPSPVVAVIAAAALGFGFSFPWASVASTVLKQTPAGERGSALGVLSAFYDLFVGVSSVAAGAVSSRFGYPAAFLMSAAALVVAALTGRLVFAAGKEERALAAYAAD
ncbi:MAG TPA: MFS transporter [Bryobacteraceae bacterium]|jgi:MFS family permease